MPLSRKAPYHRCLGFHSFLLLWLILLLPLSVLAGTPPQWLSAYVDGSLQLTGQYYGISFADYRGKRPTYEDMRLAKDRAVSDLCYKLSVSVKSEFKEKLAQKGSHSEEEVSSALYVSTLQVVSGVEEKDRWMDRRQRKFWSMLVIDKAEADRQLARQKFVNDVVYRLENRQEDIAKGIEAIARLMKHQMDVYNQRMDHYENLLNTIDVKVEASGAETKKAYENLRQEIIRLGAIRNDQIEQMSADKRQQDRRIEELIRQNQNLQQLMGQISNKIQNDYFLALTSEDVRNQAASPQYWIRIEPHKGQGADYFHGEKIRFNIKASHDFYIKVIYLSSTAAGSNTSRKINTILFPNAYDRDNRIRAGEQKVIGVRGELVVQPPFGRDVITVVASTRQFSDLKEQVQKADGGYYQEVSDNTRGAIAMRTRGIGIVASKSELDSEDEPPAVGVTSDTCFISSHRLSN